MTSMTFYNIFYQYRANEKKFLPVLTSLFIHIKLHIKFVEFNIYKVL